MRNNGVRWLPVGGLLAALFFVPSALGQSYPERPIRIVTSPPGGGSDLTARLIADNITGPLGQPVIIENRANNVGATLVAQSEPDGYTLLEVSSSMWLRPFFQKDVGYDPVKDFAPVTVIAISPSDLVTHPSVPAKSVKELVALAKAKPAALNVATGPTGSTNHLAAELFQYMAGVKFTRVAYRGGGPGLIALIGGETQLTFGSAGSCPPTLIRTKFAFSRSQAASRRSSCRTCPRLRIRVCPDMSSWASIRSWRRQERIGRSSRGSITKSFARSRRPQSKTGF